MGFKLIQDIHDQADTNDAGIREFEDYLDVSSQNYENFKPVNQFHNEYEQFPTVYYENTLEEPKEEKEKKKDRRDSSSSDKSSSSSSGSSSASGSSEGASSSSGPTGAESSVGAATGASSSAALANASASQILSTTFVAMVAVTAVVVPIIENADLEVDLDVDYNAGILTYMIELVNASEGSDYYAVVMEGQTVILQQQIFDNYQSNTLTDLRNSQEHRVEVRTGTPPLLVVASEVIPATPSWAEWGHLTVDYNSIDYGVYFHGDSGEAVLKLTDPNSGEALYTKELVDGLNSDVIGGLFSSHLYTLAVETETEVLLFKDIQTEYRDVSWNHLTVIDNVIDYGVEVNLGDAEVTISLYDPSISSVIYSMDLTPGYNEDVIRDLEYNHTYELTVASVDETFLFETVITDSEPITVTVGHLTPKDNTIDYELIVSGEGKTVTLDIYDAAGGPSLYTTTLTSGTNTGIIEGLSYSHSYLLTVSSASKTYLSESVTTEAEPTKVTLDSLTSTETTVEYKVTVTGNRDTVTAYLKDPTSGETLYTKELTVGVNTAVIEELETGHTYQFTVTSKTETFIDRTITTGSKPTEVTLNQLTTSDNTIDYEVTVTGNSEVVTAYLYNADGEEVYSKELSEGTNSDTIKDLEYDSVYRFTISSETQIYVSEEVTISASITVESLAADGLIINYKMTVNGTEDASIILFRSEDNVQIESATLPAGKTTEGTFRGTGDLPIEPNKVYYVKGYIDGKEYNLGSVTPESKVITEELSPDGDYIFFTIEVIKSAGSEMDLYVYNSKGKLLEEYSQKYPINRDRETVEGAIIHIPWGDTYTIKAKIDGQTYAVGEVDVVDEPSFTANGNTIVYSFTVDDKALLTSVYFDSVDGGSVTLSLGQSEDGKFIGAVTKIPIGEKDYFVFKWGTEYKVTINSGSVFYEGKVTTDPFDATISNASATGNVVQATVTFGMTNLDDIEVVLYADSEHREQVAGSARTPTGSTLAYECTGLEYNKSYYIGVTYNGDLMTDTVKVTTGKMPQNPSADDITLVYGDEEECIVVTGLEGEPELSYTIQSGSSFVDVDADGYLTWKEAGVTVIRVTYSETPVYAGGYIDVEVTAIKAEQSPTGNTFDFVYGGQDQLSVGDLDDLPIEVTYTANAGSAITVTSSGKLTWVSEGSQVVTANIPETTHYNSMTFDITVTTVKADSDIVLDASDKIYNKDDKSLVTITGNDEQKQNVMYLDDSSNWTYTIPVYDNVGDYIVTYKVDATEHYNAIEQKNTRTIIISKAQQNPTASDIEIQQDESKTVTVNDLDEDPELSFSVQSGGDYVSVDATTGVLTWKKEGESTVRVSYDETTNYMAGYKDIKVTALKPVAYVTGLKAKTYNEFDGSEHELVSNNDYTEVVGGTIMFYWSTSPLTTQILKELTDADWNYTVSQSAANRYYVYYKIEASSTSSYDTLRPNENQVVVAIIESAQYETKKDGQNLYITITFSGGYWNDYQYKLYDGNNELYIESKQKSSQNQCDVSRELYADDSGKTFVLKIIANNSVFLTQEIHVP